MKRRLLCVLVTALLGLLSSAVVFGQDDRVVSAAGDAYVISAKAGGINNVEGRVAVTRREGKSGYLLKNDKLEIGDRVRTGADGKAEILLNPGSFIRLGADTGFEFITTDLDDLKLRLSAGSAILEVYADNEFKVSVATPAADISLTRSGVYRIDLLTDGSSKLSVWKGKAFVGENQAEVKSGRSAVVNSGQATVVKFDRDNKDELDLWSQMRAKEASRINARLQRNSLRNSLLTSFNQGSWNMYNSFGLWVYDRTTGRWCFLPFGFGWSSPYGYDYGFNIWSCRLPVYVQQPPVAGIPPRTTGGNTPTTQNPNDEERRPRVPTPTFQRFENNQRGGEQRGGGRSGDGGIFNNGGVEMPRSNRKSDDTIIDSRPTYTPPPPSTSAPIIVMPGRGETKGKDN